MSNKPLIPIVSSDLSMEWFRENCSGSGVQVAVIDSGIDVHHPDLQGKVIRSCRVIKNKENVAVAQEIPVEESTDDFGHGTAVAGIITNIASDAEIINVRVLNEYNACTGEILIEGIKWALDQKIKIINMSLATLKPKFFTGLMDLCERAYEQDAVLVVSKRNVGGLGCPAMFSSVVSVEIGEDLNETFQFRYKTGNLIECDANGLDIKVPAPGGQYTTLTGTSFATPHVAGMITLMLEAYPDLTTPEIKTMLKHFQTKS